MVRIRLHRTGATKRAMYRVVALDGRTKQQGRVLEWLGTYDPAERGGVSLNLEAIDAWIAKGAQPSSTVNSLIKQHRKAAAEAAAAPAAG